MRTVLDRTPHPFMKGVVVAVVLGLAGGLACFSEHEEATGTTEGTCTIPLNDSLAGSALVVIQRFTFVTGDLAVPAGGRVTWINCDLESHTSTADGGQWSSPLLAPGDVFTRTFSTPGEFAYHCEPHPFMTGRIVVE